LGAQLRQPPFEEAPFGIRVNELQRSVVGLARLFDAVDSAQQLRARRVEDSPREESGPLTGARFVVYARTPERTSTIGAS
jgi:hypothetical protein